MHRAAMFVTTIGNDGKAEKTPVVFPWDTENDSAETEETQEVELQQLPPRTKHEAPTWEDQLEAKVRKIPEQILALPHLAREVKIARENLAEYGANWEKEFAEATTAREGYQKEVEKVEKENGIIRSAVARRKAAQEAAGRMESAIFLEDTHLQSIEQQGGRCYAWLLRYLDRVLDDPNG